MEHCSKLLSFGQYKKERFYKKGGWRKNFVSLIVSDVRRNSYSRLTPLVLWHFKILQKSHLLLWPPCGHCYYSPSPQVEAPAWRPPSPNCPTGGIDAALRSLPACIGPAPLPPPESPATLKNATCRVSSPACCRIDCDAEVACSTKAAFCCVPWSICITALFT